ncbi:hypothetical protein ACHAXS_004455, partial [Conticribra weissflogii]
KTDQALPCFQIYFNTALVDWHLKFQATIETRVFGTEFVTVKLGVDTQKQKDQRYKLRMMHVFIGNATQVYGDNMFIIKNTSKPSPP